MTKYKPDEVPGCDPYDYEGEIWCSTHRGRLWYCIKERERQLERAEKLIRESMSDTWTQESANAWASEAHEFLTEMKKQPTVEPTNEELACSLEEHFRVRPCGEGDMCFILTAARRLREVPMTPSPSTREKASITPVSLPARPEGIVGRAASKRVDTPPAREEECSCLWVGSRDTPPMMVDRHQDCAVHGLEAIAALTDREKVDK